MDNQNQIPVQPQAPNAPPVNPVVPPPQPQPQMATASPMPEPQSQSGYQPQPVSTPPTPSTGSSRKTLYILVVAILLLLIGVGAYYYYSGSLSSGTDDTSVVPTVIPQVETEEPSPTVTPIESSSDLDGALNQIDGMDPSTAEAELNANTQDSTTFSQ